VGYADETGEFSLDTPLIEIKRINTWSMTTSGLPLLRLTVFR